MGAANLPSATINPSTVRVPNDSANASISWIVSNQAIHIKLKEVMGRWGPVDMHGGLSDGVVLNREDEVEVDGDGIDFFEDGVTVELESLYDRLVSCGPDRPSRNREKDKPRNDA